MNSELHTQLNPNLEKFKELVLYIAERCETDPTYGATKLNKVLFFSDFLCYRKTGKPITGVAYQRIEHGPAPKPLLSVKSEMTMNKEAVEAEREFYDRTQKRLIALKHPRLDLFTAEEISIVDKIIEVLWGKSAADVSELSHLTTSYELVEYGEEIPYETILVSNESPTPEDIAWANQFVQR